MAFKRHHTQKQRHPHTKRKTLRRARVIGKGVTSCVVKPRYRCKDETPRDYRKKSQAEVGKVMNKGDAKEESRYDTEMNKLDPRNLFTLGKSRVCMPKGSPSDIRTELIAQGCNTRRLMKDMNQPVAMVISSYGGKSVDKIDPDTLAQSFLNLLESTTPSSRTEQQMVSIMVTESLRLLYAVARIQQSGRTHFDFHSGNVLINPTTGELRVIDFVNANTNDFMVSNNVIIGMIIRYASLIGLRNYHQFPTELPILALLATNNNGPNTNTPTTLYPVVVLDPDLPPDIRDAIEDGAEGRSPSALRAALRRLSPNSPYLVIGDVLLPDRIPEGDVLFHERCQAIVGMRKMTASAKSTANKTRLAFRECIRTIDSFAAGNVLHEYIVKTIGGLGSSSQLDIASLDVLLRIVDALRNPDPSKRVHVKRAIQSLLSLGASLPKDPRGLVGDTVRTEVRTVV